MKTKKIFVSFLFLIFISEISSAQITFQKTFGGIGIDYGYSVQQTIDEGYIISGRTESFGAGNNDAYLIKTDSIGETLWTKTFGGISYEVGKSVQQTMDGGYIIVGETVSFGAGSYGIYLIKTNANGDSLWTKTFGGGAQDYGYSVQQTTDGGYIIAGFTISFGADDEDIYLIKIDANGDSIWTKTFGRTDSDFVSSVQQTTDGGYIIAGFTVIFGVGYFDVYLIKTDANGNLLWTKTFAGIDDDRGYSVQQTIDGGYIITGQTQSFGAGNFDVYLIKTDDNGDSLWTKTFGGTNSDGGHSVQQTTDGGYIITGQTQSFGAGEYDVYLLKTNANGDLLWTKTFGGLEDDLGLSVQQTKDEGYIITGFTLSYGSGNSDVYLIKTDSLGNSGCNEGSTATIVTSPPTQVSSPATIVTSPPTIVTSPATIVGSGGIVTTLCYTTGINSNSNSNSSISISPNSFHTATTISLNGNFSFSDLTFKIFNVDGKTLRQFPVTSRETTIQREGLAAGVYFYQVTDGEIVKTNGKLLVQ